MTLTKYAESNNIVLRLLKYGTWQCCFLMNCELLESREQGRCTRWGVGGGGVVRTFSRLQRSELLQSEIVYISVFSHFDLLVGVS